MQKVPKYYSYMIIFRGDTEEVQPIVGVCDLEKLRLDNQGRMHMFDDLLNPILPAVEYCLHMPRIEMDTYDVDTRVLDNAYDVPHNICIIPDTAPFIEQIMSQFTFIIYADNCMEHVKKLAQSRKCELVSMPVSELSQDSLKDHWKLLFDKRIAQNAERLEDIDKQFLLSWDKQLILPALATARQYGKVDVVYNKIFNSVDIFETCANVIWNQLVHHNALMSCSSFSGIDGDLFQKMFSESEKNAEKTTRVNVVITMPGIPRRQVKLGGLNPEVPFDEKKVIRLLALHAAIVEGKYWSSSQSCYYIRVIEAIDCGVKRGLVDDVRANERGSKLYRVFVASTSEKAAAVNFCVNQLDDNWGLNFTHEYSGSVVTWLCSQLVWAGYRNQDIDIECASGGGVGVLPKDITEKSEKVTYVEYKFCPYSISDGTYYIKNCKSGLRLDVRGSIANSSQIQQYTAGNYNDQKWVITYNSSGRYYTIRNAASTVSNPYYLDVASPASGAHAKVKLWYTNTNIEEKWYIQLLANGKYRFINAYSGLCMDIQGGSTSSGADVQVYPYEGTEDQKWLILAV